MAESENPLPSVEEAAEQTILLSQVLCPFYDSEPESECDINLYTLSDDDEDYHSLPPTPMASPPPESDPRLADSFQYFFDSCPMETDFPLHDEFGSDGNSGLEGWVPTEGSPFSSGVVSEEEAGRSRPGPDGLPDPIVTDSDELRISFGIETHMEEPLELEADRNPDLDWEFSQFFQQMNADQVTRPASPDSDYFFDQIPDELFDCLPEQDPNPEPNPYSNTEPVPDWDAVSTTDSSSVPDLEEMVRNLEWEVLLAMNNIYATDAEMTFFREFLEQDITVKGGPPASKSVVESLPNVTIDESKDDLHCAVCKESFLVGESLRRLPCSHDYHGNCILPWLGIRNTCPLCRFELPTDDLDYERWRGRQENQV